MTTKETYNVQYTEKRLLQNEFYFKYIFTKTEKIVYTVLYSIRHSASKDTNDRVYEQLETAAIELMDTAVGSLTVPLARREVALYSLIEQYFALESRIKMAEAAGMMSPDIAAVFLAEIEGTYRSIERFRMEARSDAPAHGITTTAPRTGRRGHSRSYAAPGQSSEIGERADAAAEKGSRRERIRTIIKDRGEVSIKDISDIITDVSEKTIQRELNDMIAEGQILRRGERRWSRYVLPE